MLKFFDANCYIGKQEAPNIGSFHSVEILQEKMKLCNIERALVWHISALEYHPVRGNQEILKIAREKENIIPVWLVMPNHTGEFYDPPELSDVMKKNDVRAVKLFPKYNSLTYSLEEWSCGALLNQLERNDIPAIINIDETDWNTLYGVCLRHPKLSVIVTNIYYRHGRYFYPLLKELDNLYIETSFYKNFLGIEDICHRFGAERLIFGTSMPFLDPGPAVAMILYADISQEEKELIAGKNLQRLLGL